MNGIGENQRKIIQPEFDRSISIDFARTTIASDAGILLLRQVDERFKILEFESISFTLQIPVLFVLILNPESN